MCVLTAAACFADDPVIAVLHAHSKPPSQGYSYSWAIIPQTPEVPKALKRRAQARHPSEACLTSSESLVVIVAQFILSLTKSGTEADLVAWGQNSLEEPFWLRTGACLLFPDRPPFCMAICLARQPGSNFPVQEGKVQVQVWAFLIRGM